MTSESYFIDWEEQWRLHGANYKDGFVHVELPSRLLKLKPGPGFGDLSHPTTRLMLTLMKDCVVGRTVVDIGCGSGILTLAAAALGAEKCIGVDIDPQAVEHSKNNAQINGLQATFCHAEEFPLVEENCVILLNMITSEQKVAWAAYEKLLPNATDLLASGILAEEKAAYLKAMQKKGWKLLIKEEKMKGWRAFHLKKHIFHH